MSDEKIIRPGFASEEEPNEEALPELPADMGHAHYAGLEGDDAVKTWKREALCVRCILAPMCKVAAHVDEPLVVVSRCLAFLPHGG